MNLFAALKQESCYDDDDDDDDDVSKEEEDGTDDFGVAEIKQS